MQFYKIANLSSGLWSIHLKRECNELVWVERTSPYFAIYIHTTYSPSHQICLSGEHGWWWGSHTWSSPQPPNLLWSCQWVCWADQGRAGWFWPWCADHIEHWWAPLQSPLSISSEFQAGQPGSRTRKFGNDIIAWWSNVLRTFKL